MSESSNSAQPDSKALSNTLLFKPFDLQNEFQNPSAIYQSRLSAGEWRIPKVVGWAGNTVTEPERSGSDWEPSIQIQRVGVRRVFYDLSRLVTNQY